MEEPSCTYSFSRIPYLLYDTLDDYAEKVIAGYQPDKLRIPAPIDVESFLEFHLGLSVEYHKLSGDDDVLGLTAFNSGYVQVLDERSRKPRPLPVAEGTVIVDTALLSGRNEARLRFTLMHEASHWLLHRQAFSAANAFFNGGKFGNQYIAAKEGRIDYSRSQLERTDNERMERQADFLAAALLMPKPALRIVYREFFRYYNQQPVGIVRGKNTLHDCWAKQLPRFVAKRFCVSRQAALIRLEKLGAIGG